MLNTLCWVDIGDRRLLGPKIIVQTVKKVKVIRERLKAAQDRQKQWADLNRKSLEFETGDKVFLKISPTRGVIRFSSQGNLRGSGATGGSGL